MLGKDSILAATSGGLSVFRHYIGTQWKVGRNFRNPLYNDTKPSCNIYFDRKTGCYRMKDFGNDDYSGDCFFVVGKIKGLDCSKTRDFIEIMRAINREMFLGISEEFERVSNDATVHITQPKRKN